MINTIMLDLDGTLLKYSQDAFIDLYFKEIRKVFAKLDMDVALSIKAIWAGTKAMIANDGEKLNKQRFWKVFADVMGLDDKMLAIAEDACDRFYANEFNLVRSVMEPDDISRRLVHAMTSKGYDVVLATNPFFPAVAVASRLGWTGLSPQDFVLVTHYSNSTYCKPNPEYYREVFQKIGKEPGQCFMLGNSVVEDMSVGALGVETFLVTDHLENDSGADISAFRHGSLDDAEMFLMSLTDVVR
jgi:FMN phosphatase YigB (HAD superfamily)